MITMSKKCKACGKAIRNVYTYCAECYNRINGFSFYEPQNIKTNKCKKCGIEIGTRYVYCYSCAKNANKL